MSTKKSRQVRSSKFLKPEDIAKIINSDESDDELNEQQQKEINQKLSECGLLEDNLNWTKKKELMSSINASICTAQFEEQQRNSPKSNSRSLFSGKEEIKASNAADVSKAKVTVDVIDIDDDIISIEPEPCSVPAHEKKGSIARYLFEPLKQVFGAKSSEQISSNHSQLTDTKKTATATSPAPDVNGRSKPSSEKSHIKTDNDEKELINCHSSGDDNDDDLFFIGKKRSSPPETEGPVSVKKFKANSPVFKMSAVNCRKPLRTELELEKRRRSIKFHRRSVQLILHELEQTHIKWKEAASKHKLPTRWGTPIVKNCSEKWDSRFIPPKLLNRYQKFLLSHDLNHPVFYPENTEDLHLSDDYNQHDTKEVSENEVNILDKDTNGNSKSTTLESKVSETTSHSVAQEDKADFSTEDLELLTTGPRMSLRNRKHAKPIIGEDDPQSSGDSEEWLTAKSKPSRTKKGFKNKKKQKIGIPIIQTQPCVVRLEKYRIFPSKNNENVIKEEPETVKEKSPDVALKEERTVTESSGQDDQTLEAGPPEGDNEDVDCPICNKSFKKLCIEAHAIDCASKTFQD